LAFSTVGNLTIINGNISACGDSGVGIGAGFGYLAGRSIVENLTIVNGSIDSKGSLAAGIGAGRAERDSATSLVSELTILNGQINAIGSSAAGIGAGYGCSSGHSSVTTLKIQHFPRY
jgi:hypothetical protein